MFVLEGECLASCPSGYSESYDGKSCVEGLLDFPIIYYPHLIIAAFLISGTFIGYFRHGDTLILSNLVATFGALEMIAFFTQTVVAFALKADKYGAASLLGLVMNIILNYMWFNYFKKNMRDPSF
jgi:hypothetical protein